MGPGVSKATLKPVEESGRDSPEQAPNVIAKRVFAAVENRVARRAEINVTSCWSVTSGLCGNHCGFSANPINSIKRSRSSRSEEHTSELQSPCNLVCRLLLEK